MFTYALGQSSCAGGCGLWASQGQAQADLPLLHSFTYMGSPPSVDPWEVNTPGNDTGLISSPGVCDLVINGGELFLMTDDRKSAPPISENLNVNHISLGWAFTLRQGKLPRVRTCLLLNKQIRELF